ncbi:MAG: NTP transferase domain-containing protein [Desulfurococcales archaeon]|nr:NTP transferase domain-containing protein [Desulfurococcales archaeon]
MYLKAVVLAGGEPSRLSMLVPRGRSKHTLRVLGKPVIYYPLNAIVRNYSGEIILVYSYSDVVRDAKAYLEAGILRPIKQSIPGIEGAILSASNELGDTDYFLLVFGDLIFDPDAIYNLLDTFYRVNPDAAVLTIPLEERFASTYGIATVDLNGFVKKVVEKPPSIELVEKPVYTLGGAYILPTTILDYLEKNNSLPDAISKLATTGKVACVYWSGLWVDIGYPVDLLEASRLLLSRLGGVKMSSKAVVEDNVVLKPPVYIDEGAYIDHYTVIKGPVYIGRESFIGAHSFIRHYSSLEDHVRIGAYTEIKNSILQPYTLVDSHCFIGDSIIGENTSIGDHVVTLNILPENQKPPRLRQHLVQSIKGRQPLKLGSIIGYNTIVGAGTILYPGTTIKPNTRINPGSKITT